MAYHYPRLEYGDRCLSSRELDHVRFLVVGTCQLEPIVGAMHGSGHHADHILWDGHAHTEFPHVESVVSYDACVIGLTLRHVIYRAILDIYPELPEQLIEIELLWIRVVTDGLVEDFLDACKRIIRLQLAKTEPLAGTIPTFFVSFIEPRRNPLGNLFKKYDMNNISYFVLELNKYIERKISNLINCYFFDVNEIFAEYGRVYVQDDYVFPIVHASFIHDFNVDSKAASQRINPLTTMCQMYETIEQKPKITHAVAQRLVDNVHIVQQPLAIKLIICDLDDTLWRGISGEKEHMTWDETDGWPLALAEALLVYKARGGMLAICSKNEREPTLDKFRQAFKDGLKIEDFVSVHINYESKADNVRRILSEVNILPQNALFIDDNPREVDEVRKVFSEMHFLNDEPYDWRRKILFSPLTQVATVSNEARLRTQSVQAKIQRDEARDGTSREAWLASLEIVQTYSIVDSSAHPDYARAFELINKTNQFNTTGRRWNEDEMRTFLAEGGRIFCTFLKDRMVDSGLIGAVVFQEERIIQQVLSCRVFGLLSEYATMHHLTALILGSHTRVVATLTDTGRNFTCHGFFASAGFTEADGEPGTFFTAMPTPEPAHIASTVINT